MCRWCGTELEPRAGRGRKPVYCGVRCRRGTEVRVREIREQAAREGRGLSGTDKAAITRADQIIDDTQSVRDEIVKRDAMIRDLEGCVDEFRRTDGLGDVEARMALRRFGTRTLD